MTRGRWRWRWRWDDSQYLKFADERTRAARELLARVPSRRESVSESEGGRDLRIIDLGCGPGNSTALLAERWPGAHITGVDSSGEMLERARRDHPALNWQQADVQTWTPTPEEKTEEEVDLIFANAVFHWLPDHEQLLPRLLRCLRPGGVLAFQVPRNFEEPSHRAMRDVPGPWHASLRAVRALTPVAAPSFYYDVLALEAEHIDVWQTIYEHVLPSAAAIVEWVKGTGLRPYLEAVDPALRDSYLAAYQAAIDAAYPARRDGQRLFTFPRLFVVARRRGPG